MKTTARVTEEEEEEEVEAAAAAAAEAARRALTLLLLDDERRMTGREKKTFSRLAFLSFFFFDLKRVTGGVPGRWRSDSLSSVVGGG